MYKRQRFGIAFVWLAVPAGWLANFLISYAALRRSWPEDKAVSYTHLKAKAKDTKDNA